ncbi:site-specific recombinase, DNA invertase Pin [Desulfocapsa sulfexigens DSM 10523]|uniref:Site-specific recombinase, DNA invertase Pin n=1 Tax=Desulfocapsa sulfexigens (strain DSM 10523 / SB164P1) TaxID=1167006 RepID=M1P937_DESSD|nr:recombinase family protein [Desulfocapsa sulfexigens]AGF79968.1 site-specific recombinase, DNA invertase Pin [Desulfocapsa sulfexigens DSM 10523]
MTTIGYVFLDVERNALVPLERQRLVIEEYAKTLKLYCDELLVEESYSPAVSLMERKQGALMLKNVNDGDNILVMHAKWVFGNPRNALSLLEILKKKKVSLFCADLEGNVSMPTQKKLVASEGISSLVYQLCNALSFGERGNHGAAIRAGKAKRKKEGKYLGGPVPFGWKVGEDGRLEQDPEQQELIGEMVRLKADRWSYRDIAKKMQNGKGLTLSHEGIRRILLNNSNKSQ